MTILDGALQFTGVAGTVTSDTPTTGTQNSTNIIDLVQARDMGIGDDPALKVFAVATAAFTVGTSIQIEVQGAPDNGSGVPGTWTTMATGPVVLEAAAVIGAHLCDIDLPRKVAGIAIPRFLRLRTVTVGTHSTGTYFASIVLDRQDDVYYPAGITIAN